MKFDVIVIGGGHSGLEKATALQKGGCSCLVISSGEGARRFKDKDWSQKEAVKDFESAGGTFLFGDTVISGIFEEGRLKAVLTEKQGTVRFEADDFYLATGSFFSKGLVAERDRVIEPALGLDVDFTGDHSTWVNPDFYAEQPFMKFGVKTDDKGHPFLNGCPVDNLFAIGSIVSKL